MIESFFKGNTLEDIYNEMKMVYLNDKRPWVIGYSGGKDSTVVVELVFNMLLSLPESKRHKDVYVVSSDTLIENPIILDYLKTNIQLINESAKKQRLPIKAEIVYPEVNDTFWVNIIGRGYPPPKSLMFRWCTERLKIRPSNKFIQEKLEVEDVVVLLGVRKAESMARRRRIENRKIEGYLLTPHATLKSDTNIAYVYNPIVDLTTDDVWEVLLNKYKGMSPWGTDNNKLFSLYAKGSGEGECPFITTDNKDKNTCGNSRFGCWVCTVVSEDKSLKGFIEWGEEWLIPLAKFRDWIKSEDFRNNPKYRKKHKRNGAVHKTQSGNIIFGPFNFEARKIILRKLLELQLIIQEYNPDFKLITMEELKAIDELWDDEEDLSRRSLVNLYLEVTGERLPWHDYKQPMFEDLALSTIEDLTKDHGLNLELVRNLLIQTDKYKHYSNPTKLKKSIDKLLNQQWLHYDIEQQIESESKAIKEIDYED